MRGTQQDSIPFDAKMILHQCFDIFRHLLLKLQIVSRKQENFFSVLLKQQGVAKDFIMDTAGRIHPVVTAVTDYTIC